MQLEARTFETCARFGEAAGIVVDACEPHLGKRPGEWGLTLVTGIATARDGGIVTITATAQGTGVSGTAALLVRR